MREEYDFLLLKEHYKTIRFVPQKRYTFMTPFLAFNYPEGFLTEYEFRSELFRRRPIFVANAPPDNEIVIDVDYRIETFEEEKFEEATTIGKIVAKALKSVLPIEEIRFRFSGRGIHVVGITDVVEIAKEIQSEKGLRTRKDPRALVNKYVFYGLRKTFDWANIKQYVDKSNLASNKIYRTPNSLNEKTMLPVVEFRPGERINLEKIINSVTKPRTFFVKFSKPVWFRDGETYTRGRFGYVDEYEFLRLILKNNYHIEDFKVV